ncbi:MAG: M1 family metallopeptidase, partial [Polyangiaceae bacterium]
MNRRWFWGCLAVITGGCASASPVSTETAATSPASVQKSVTVAEPLPPTGMLLPRTALPTRYTVELTLDNAETKVRGDIAIDLKIAEPTRVVWLHGRDLVVREAHFEVSGKSIEARTTPDTKGERIGFFTATAENLPAGAARLTVRFEATVLENADRGIFREKEGNDFYIFSQFENTDARSAFPCFDEPNVKTPWDVTLDVPATQTALGNTHVVSETTPQNGRKKVKFAETQPLPAYLVAFAVGPFDLVDGGKAGKAKVPVRIATPRGAGAEAAYAAKITADLIGVLEEYFGIPFPYDKLDVVPIPTLITWGAMENAGLITFFREGVLARAGEDSETFRRRYADIMAHELAHQWFGDLVTMQWWDDIWL